MCQGESRPLNAILEMFREVPASAFQVVSLDLAGRFDPAWKVEIEPWAPRRVRNGERTLQPKKPKYCLVMVDKLTRYPVFAAVINTLAQTTMKALHHHLYTTFGVPEAVIVDQASCFTSREMAAQFSQVECRWI